MFSLTARATRNETIVKCSLIFELQSQLNIHTSPKFSKVTLTSAGFFGSLIHGLIIELVVHALSQKDSRFRPEKFSSSILQQSVCPGVEISFAV